MNTLGFSKPPLFLHTTSPPSTLSGSHILSRYHPLSNMYLGCWVKRQGNLWKEECIWCLLFRRDRSPLPGWWGVWQKADVALGRSRESYPDPQTGGRVPWGWHIWNLRPTLGTYSSNKALALILPKQVQTGDLVFKCPRLEEEHVIQTVTLTLPNVCPLHPKLSVQVWAHLAQNKPPKTSENVWLVPLLSESVELMELHQSLLRLLFQIYLPLILTITLNNFTPFPSLSIMGITWFIYPPE